MNSNLLSIVLYIFFWAKNRWQLKLGWCKKEDQLREILFCVNLIDRQRQTLVHFFCFFCLCFFLSFFKSCCQLVFLLLFFLSLTVTKFMHYFNKGCFRGTLIQWWKRFLIFFLIQFCCYRFVCFLSPRRRHIVSRANDAWHLTPKAAKYNSLTTIQNCILHGCE